MNKTKFAYRTGEVEILNCNCTVLLLVDNIFVSFVYAWARVRVTIGRFPGVFLCYRQNGNSKWRLYILIFRKNALPEQRGRKKLCEKVKYSIKGLFLERYISSHINKCRDAWYGLSQRIVCDLYHYPIISHTFSGISWYNLHIIKITTTVFILCNK